MRALAVVTSSLFDQIEDHKKHLISIDNVQIPLAFIEGGFPEFDVESDQYANFVLVKKSSFSLNYRDLGVIENAWQKLKTTSIDTFYPVGSDFAGHVIAIGKNVRSFSVGDLVMGNCFYPEAENGAMPGIPSNHSSKEYEIYHYGKLIKVPSYLSDVEAGALGIGTQTANAMVRKANIKKGDNVLVTSVTSNTSYFLLNALWDMDCTVYGLSYSGKNIELVREHFPFLKEIFSINEKNIPNTLLIDVVLDSFSDTYLEFLLPQLNLNARYLTCGVFNQSIDKLKNVKPTNLTLLIANLMMRNISFIGNCLGTTQDLISGLEFYKTKKLLVDSIFTEEDSLSDFITQSFNLGSDKFGKVIYQYTENEE
ncbi:MAG: zinc-binding alcohol dehydrogenase family protein [Flavobacterium sp.]